MNRPRPVLAVALAGVAAILSLAACGDTSRALKTEAGAVETSSTLTPTPSSATTTTRPPTTTTTTPDDEFRALMVRYGLPPASALKAGHASCDALNSGVDLETLALAIVEEVGYDKAEMAGRVIGAAVTTFCPEHRPQVDAFVAAHGS